jgi:membrane protease YdiL (CAAX protease family)
MQILVGAAAAAIVTVGRLGMFAYWSATTVAIAMIEVLLLARLGWWRHVGFRGSTRPRMDLLLWIPLCPILVWNLSQVDMAALVTPTHMASLLLLTVLAAFVEEVLYRGLMLRALVPQGVWRAAVVTALLFGIMHLLTAFAGSELAVVVGRTVYAAAIGFAYAAYALRTRLIWPVILVHALANFADLIDQEAIFQESAPTEADLIRWLIYVVVFTLYGTLVLRSITHPKAQDAP